MKISTKKQQCEYWEIVECTTKGNRSSMEDTSALLYPFKTSCSLFLGVFDGHAGIHCSNYLSNTLPAELQKMTKQIKSPLPSQDLIQQVFQNTDQQWLDLARNKAIEDGSTALCLALNEADLIVANCGDSRAILYQGGSIVPLTRDHRPEDYEEKQRIIKQGGTVIGGRLQGKLGVSRAFGNSEFKESKYLISEPEIKEVNLDCDAQFLVVGCDGLFEKLSNFEIVNFIKNNIPTKSLEEVIQELVEEALDRGTEDNITVMVVKFKKAYKKLLKKNKKNLSKSHQRFLSSAKGISLKTSGKIKSSRPSELITINSESSVKPKKDNPLRMAGKHPISSSSSPSCSIDPSTLFPIGIIQLERKFQPNHNHHSPKTQSPKTQSPPKSARDNPFNITIDINNPNPTIIEEKPTILRSSFGFKKSGLFIRTLAKSR